MTLFLYVLDGASPCDECAATVSTAFHRQCDPARGAVPLHVPVC